MCAAAGVARGQAGRPNRHGRRDRARVRRLLLRRHLRRRLAGAVAAADQLRRTRSLCRAAGGAAQKQRPGAVALSGRTRRFLQGRGRKGRRRHRATGSRSKTIEPGAGRTSRGQAGRHRLSAIFERFDPFSARRCGHASRAARQPPCARLRPQGRSRRTACISWLPWYHDMGLVGCLLSPVAMQMSVDYLKTEDFARRPLAWLDLITRNPGTTLSYSPTFGYDICSRRMSSQTRAEDRFDLSRWRIAGNGADMIRPDVMQAFVDSFAPAGFEASAFCPSYGLAEATLAVSLMPPGEGIRLELVEENELSGCAAGRRGATAPLPRGGQLRPAGRRHGGRDPRRRRAAPARPRHRQGLCSRRAASCTAISATRNRPRPALSPDGWLDTGDMGYMSAGYIFIVGRAKDMIIINGRNHWPQDIEWAVEQLPGFKSGDIAAFAITGPSGEETPAVLVHCRVSRPARARPAARRHPRARPRDHRHHSGGRAGPAAHAAAHQLGQAVAHQGAHLYLSGEIQPYDIAA